MVQWLQMGRIRSNVGSFLQDQRGSVFAIMGVSIVMAAGIAALTIDMGYLYVLKGRLQATADFATMAAVVQLPDENAARTTALEYAAKNMPASEHGGVLANADVVAGNWDAGTRTFTPGDTPVNAVRVVTRRAQANGNAAGLFFASVLGFQQVDIETAAIAALKSNGCLSSGIMAAGNVQLDQNVTIGNNYCIYSDQGVHFDKDGTVEAGSYIVSPDITNITYDPGFSAPANALVEATHDVSTAANAGQLIDDIENGISWPPFIDNVQVVASLPDNPVAGTAYVINDNVLIINKNVTASDVVIAVRGNISWGQNGVIQHSNPGCTNGDPAIAVVATGDIELGQNSTVYGAQLITAGNLYLRQQSSFTGSAIVDGNVQIDQGAEAHNPCPSVFGLPGAGVNSLSRLVR